MKECRFLLQEITIIQREKKTCCLVTNDCFYHVGCDIFFQVHCFLMNLFVLRLVMMLVIMCTETTMRNKQHVFIALCDLGVLFLLFFLSVLFFLFLFIMRVLKSCEFYSQTLYCRPEL